MTIEKLFERINGMNYMHIPPEMTEEIISLLEGRGYYGNHSPLRAPAESYAASRQQAVAGPWKFEVKGTGQIADTGDYGDGYYEISNGEGVALMTQDMDDNGDPHIIAICDALNASEMKFYIDDSAQYIASALQKENTHLYEILKKFGITQNNEGEWEASRQQGYSLEQVKEIAIAFAGSEYFPAMIPESYFSEWSTTPEGKSLLERSMPVGVQEPTALEFARFLEEHTRVIYEEKITLYRYTDADGPGNYILDDIYTVFKEKWEPENKDIPQDKMEVLASLMKYFYDHYSPSKTTEPEGYLFTIKQDTQVKSLIQSLFSAQPTEDAYHDKLNKMESQVLGFSFNYVEPEPQEPTEGIKDWIESEAKDYIKRNLIKNRKDKTDAYVDFKAGANAMYSHLQPRIEMVRILEGHLDLCKSAIQSLADKKAHLIEGLREIVEAEASDIDKLREVAKEYLEDFELLPAQPTGKTFLDVLEENYQIHLSEPDEEVLFPNMTKKEAVTEVYQDLIGIYKAHYSPAQPLEPTEDIKQWENAFRAYLSGALQMNATIYEKSTSIIDYVKQFVPKTVVAGMRWDWQSEKPIFDKECVFMTANWYDRIGWEYKAWEIRKIDSDEGWYWGLCDLDGDEWGAIEDLAQQMYLILPPLAKEQGAQVSDTTKPSSVDNAG